MSYTEGRTVATFNGATSVDLVGVPGASTRRLISRMFIHNPDTVPHEFELRYNANGTRYKLPLFTLAAGESQIVDDPLVLANTTDKIDAVIEGAHTTTAPTCVATWADRV